MNKIPKILLMVEASREYGREILAGVAKYARLYGPWEFILEPEFYLSFKGKNFDFAKECQGIDGIIMRDTPSESILRKIKIPIITLVATKKRLSGLYTIDTDAEKVSQLAAKHLLSKGFNNFAFCGLSNIEWSKERQKYYTDYLKKKNYTVHSYLFKNRKRNSPWATEHKNIAEWIKSLPKPVGIMACNDDRGRDIIEACKISGTKVPNEVAVIGVDNDFLICELCSTPLTSISLNLDKAGFEAAQLMSKLIKGQKCSTEPIIVEARSIVPRLSTDVFSVSDKIVLDALIFIKRNCTEPIQVPDVANEVGINRRSLNRRFNFALNKSVKDEIDRIRAEEIAKFLLETDLTISQIGEKMSFTGPDHISRFFKKLTGMNCQEYRKKHSNSLTY